MDAKLAAARTDRRRAQGGRRFRHVLDYSVRRFGMKHSRRSRRFDAMGAEVIISRRADRQAARSTRLYERMSAMEDAFAGEQVAMRASTTHRRGSSRRSSRQGHAVQRPCQGRERLVDIISDPIGFLKNLCPGSCSASRTSCEHRLPPQEGLMTGCSARWRGPDSSCPTPSSQGHRQHRPADLGLTYATPCRAVGPRRRADRQSARNAAEVFRCS